MQVWIRVGLYGRQFVSVVREVEELSQFQVDLQAFSISDPIFSALLLQTLNSETISSLVSLLDSQPIGISASFLVAGAQFVYALINLSLFTRFLKCLIDLGTVRSKTKSHQLFSLQFEITVNSRKIQYCGPVVLGNLGEHNCHAKDANRKQGLVLWMLPNHMQRPPKNLIIYNMSTISFSDCTWDNWDNCQKQSGFTNVRVGAPPIMSQNNKVYIAAVITQRPWEHDMGDTNSHYTIQ